MRYFLAVLLFLVAACSPEPESYDWAQYQPPDWKKYRADNTKARSAGVRANGKNSTETSGRFTFADLKTESDASLAVRLLGAVGKRIAFIDRRPDRWDLYRSDDEPIESIELYTHPYALGSQFGLCGTERYIVEFDDDGTISSVEVQPRYGVEGPILQRSNFNWDFYYERMCVDAPASHAPSYFPAPDSQFAHDAAQLLVILFDQAASGHPKFPISCRSWEGRPCTGDINAFLGSLKLGDIDELDAANCTFRVGPSKNECFTVTTGTHRLGPFPKYITVNGSTHMNRYRIDTVEVIEGFTVS